MATQIIGAHKGADFEGHAFYQCHKCEEPCGLGAKGKSNWPNATRCPFPHHTARWERTHDLAKKKVDSPKTCPLLKISNLNESKRAEARLDRPKVVN